MQGFKDSVVYKAKTFQKNKNDMKKTILPLVLLLMAAFAFNACSNNDDEDDRFVICPPGPSFVGEWQFVEKLDGPGADFNTHRGGLQPQSHTMQIFPFKEDGIGEIVYKLADGKTQKCEYYFPEDQERYQSNYMVIVIADPQVNQPGIPFGLEFDNDCLQLHYLGLYLTDHIPETYVYKRIK